MLNLASFNSKPVKGKKLQYLIWSVTMASKNQGQLCCDNIFHVLLTSLQISKLINRECHIWINCVQFLQCLNHKYAFTKWLRDMVIFQRAMVMMQNLTRKRRQWFLLRKKGTGGQMWTGPGVKNSGKLKKLLLMREFILFDEETSIFEKGKRDNYLYCRGHQTCKRGLE